MGLQSEIKRPSVELQKNPDPRTSEELKKLEIYRSRLINLQLKQDLEQRKKYADRIFCLICVWLFAIFGIVALQGFSFKGFDVSDKILMVLIGGTTINVLGLFVIVARYLFPNYGVEN